MPSFFVSLHSADDWRPTWAAARAGTVFAKEIAHAARTLAFGGALALVIGPGDRDGAPGREPWEFAQEVAFLQAVGSGTPAILIAIEDGAFRVLRSSGAAWNGTPVTLLVGPADGFTVAPGCDALPAAGSTWAMAADDGDLPSPPGGFRVRFDAAGISLDGGPAGTVHVISGHRSPDWAAVIQAHYAKAEATLMSVGDADIAPGDGLSTEEIDLIVRIGEDVRLEGGAGPRMPMACATGDVLVAKGLLRPADGGLRAPGGRAWTLTAEGEAAYMVAAAGEAARYGFEVRPLRGRAPPTPERAAFLLIASAFARSKGELGDDMAGLRWAFESGRCLAADDVLHAETGRELERIDDGDFSGVPEDAGLPPLTRALIDYHVLSSRFFNRHLPAGAENEQQRRWAALIAAAREHEAVAPDLYDEAYAQVTRRDGPDVAIPSPSPA